MSSSSQAQPGSHESGTGGETSTTGGDSQVDVKKVLNTETTGKPPENVNKVSGDSSGNFDSSQAQPGSQESGTGGETSTTGGDSQVDVKEVLNTETTGKPPENVNNVPG